MKILKFLMEEATGGTGAAGTGAGAAGTNGGTPPPAAAGAGAGAGGAGGAPTEWTTGLNDDLKGYVTTKGFKDPAALADSYRNLEKLVGAREKLIKLPDNMDDAKAMGEIYNRLGRPEKPEGYGFKADDDFAKWTAGTFHELGLTRKQGESLAAKWEGKVGELKKAQEDKVNADNTAQTDGLKKNWGLAYDQNLKVAKGAAKEFGLDDATIDNMEKMMGFPKVMELFHNIGTKIGEGSFVTGGGAPGGIKAPEQAKARINEIKSDPELAKRYVNGDAELRREMENLHKMAYPEEKQG